MKTVVLLLVRLLPTTTIGKAVALKYKTIEQLVEIVLQQTFVFPYTPIMRLLMFLKLLTQRVPVTAAMKKVARRVVIVVKRAAVAVAVK